MTRFEKFQQVKREAHATGVLLFLLIVFWCVAGFGLAGVPGEVLGLPLWAVAGTLGVWCFAIAGVSVLVHRYFRDMPLSDEAEEKQDTPPASDADEGGRRA